MQVSGTIIWQVTAVNKSNKNHYPIDDAEIVDDGSLYQNLHILWLQWLVQA
jgi:hypothetical protein